MLYEHALRDFLILGFEQVLGMSTLPLYQARLILEIGKWPTTDEHTIGRHLRWSNIENLGTDL